MRPDETDLKYLWDMLDAARHILAHEYDDVNQQVMWKIITIHQPVLVRTLAPVFEANPPGPEAEQNPTSP